MNYEIAYVFTITLLITKIPKKYGTEKTQIITLNSQIAVQAMYTLLTSGSGINEK